MTNLNHLFELHELAKKDAERYLKKRYLYSALFIEKGKHFIAIVGPRGVGKTILLKQLALASPDSFYISADTLGDDADLFKLAKTLSEKYAISFLLIDEIHFQKEYDKKLKKIYDFLNLRVIFTSSVSLSLIESTYDLSRRVKVENLYPFTFREYIYFKTGQQLQQLTLNAIIQKDFSKEHLRFEYLFNDYLKGDLMPFALEEPDIAPLCKNIIKKIISRDIPSVTSLKVDELSLLDKTLSFIGKSPVDGINYSSLAKNLGITKYKAEIYIHLFERAFVLNPVFPFGTNVLKEAKVLMYLPFRLLYAEYTSCVGALREDFCAEMMRSIGMPYYYLKTKRGSKTPDFLIRYDSEEIILEIGGRGKGREQFKGYEAKKKIIFSHTNIVNGMKRPLFLLGFL